MKYDLQQIRERYDAGEQLKFIFFWGHHQTGPFIKPTCFSQWYERGFSIDGLQYRCAEQWMMAEKARLFSDPETRQLILDATTPRDMKALGRKVRNFDSEVWSKNAREIVTRGNIAKFSQNDDLKRYILGTGDKVLVEASPYDRIWGIGMSRDDAGVNNPHNWKGTNRLGFCLMEARDRIKEGNLYRIKEGNF